MDLKSKNVLIVCDHEDQYLFKNYLSTHNCTYKESLSKARGSLKKEHFDGLLLYCEINCNPETEKMLQYFSENFPNLNSTVLLKKPEVKVSHFLGKNGIKHIILFNELDYLESHFSNINKTKITLDKFQIVLANLSPLLQKILHYIEGNYLNIFTITDIANYLSVNECTITREFKKHNLTSPKRLLMYFKVKHSVELLKNSDLKIKEIACLSSFTNEQRFNECFKKVFTEPPEKYRITRKISINS
jgi:YesN/AraC family two-component response regulator